MSQHQENHQVHPYSRLQPETILQALESLGQPDWQPNGSLYPLNSYENRVYQIGLNNGDMVIAKFYRPQRWTRAGIEEEHQFTQELVAQELPVVAPFIINETSLHEYEGFMFAVYPRQGGRAPSLDNEDHLEQLGRLVGRIHAIGAQGKFVQRQQLSIKTFGHANLAFLTDHNWLPAELAHNYIHTVTTALQLIEQQVANLLQQPGIRLHGDLHAGNILWTDAGPHLVDLDDCMQGPPIQDLWMFLSGDRQEMKKQLDVILDGYEQFYEFDYRGIKIIECLRTLRMLNYTAWLARRWSDPAFPHHFPWFNTPNYWQEQLQQMREQVEKLNADRGLIL